jgi:hypothetical protein
METIQQYIFENTPKQNIVNLRGSSLILWKHLYKKLYEGYMKKNTFQFHKRKTSLQNPLYHLIPPKIQTYLKTAVLNQYIYEITIQNKTFTIFFIVPHTFTDYTKNISKYLTKVYLWLYIASQYAPNRCSNTFNIFIYFTPFKKEFPLQRGIILDSINANTGFTQNCLEDGQTPTTIVIFREEEWFKVLIHECFHALRLDFSMTPIANIQTELYKLFPLNQEGNLFETYTEVWAVIIHSLILVFQQTLHKNNMDLIKKKWETIITLEKEFSVYQSIKVLQYNNLTYTDVLMGHPNCKNYKENTNVLCYYIIKSIVLWNVIDFMKWCCNTQKTFVFKTQPIQFLHFIECHYKNPLYLNTIETYENNFLPKTNTLRMTLF